MHTFFCFFAFFLFAWKFIVPSFTEHPLQLPRPRSFPPDKPLITFSMSPIVTGQQKGFTSSGVNVDHLNFPEQAGHLRGDQHHQPPGGPVVPQ